MTPTINISHRKPPYDTDSPENIASDAGSDHKSETGAWAKDKGLILIVDDEKIILQTTGDILKIGGYKVLKASNGYEALRIFTERQSAIKGVLLDLVMPGMSGLEVLEKIRQINPEVKVVIVSGAIDEKNRKAALKKGATGFLEKPFKADDLLAMIKILKI